MNSTKLQSRRRSDHPVRCVTIRTWRSIDAERPTRGLRITCSDAPETRYAQIEKELLAIVLACDRFEAYIYGRDHVTIESDHKPLEMIVLKPLSNAPKRLQRMLLQLQKYTLDVKYKKGEHMYLADTLSRAYIPECCVCTVA